MRILSLFFLIILFSCNSEFSKQEQLTILIHINAQGNLIALENEQFVSRLVYGKMELDKRNEKSKLDSLDQIYDEWHKINYYYDQLVDKGIKRIQDDNSRFFIQDLMEASEGNGLLNLESNFVGIEGAHLLYGLQQAQFNFTKSSRAVLEERLKMLRISKYYDSDSLILASANGELKANHVQFNYETQLLVEIGSQKVPLEDGWINISGPEFTRLRNELKLVYTDTTLSTPIHLTVFDEVY